MVVEEGAMYKLHQVNYVGVKLFRTPDLLTRTFFGMDVGDPFSTAKLRKGLENMRKAYGDFGYIDFVPEPADRYRCRTNTIDLTLTADEGKQFFIRRIDFVGNTTTRDKVIRREILLNEGDLFSQRLWDASILRLNQLGYFEVLKENESYTLNRNPQSNTVDVTLKVKEKGKNSIGLNGGVSGIAGSFLGFNYSTNNFLGLGETLSLSKRNSALVCGTSVLGFTEPYFLDRPLQLGFSVYIREFIYDQGREDVHPHRPEPDLVLQRSGLRQRPELHPEIEGRDGQHELSHQAKLLALGSQLRLRQFHHHHQEHRRRHVLLIHQLRRSQRA